MIEREWSKNEEQNIIDDNGKHVPNICIRHFMYKSYIRKRYGILGAGKRLKIPGCVETQIKNLYPDPKHNYVGFKG